MLSDRKSDSSRKLMKKREWIGRLFSPSPQGKGGSHWIKLLRNAVVLISTWVGIATESMVVCSILYFKRVRSYWHSTSSVDKSTDKNKNLDDRANILLFYVIITSESLCLCRVSRKQPNSFLYLYRRNCLRSLARLQRFCPSLQRVRKTLRHGGVEWMTKAE